MNSDSVTQSEPQALARRLLALAGEARLLEFGLDLEGSPEAEPLGRAIEAALEQAMDADSDEELRAAEAALCAALQAAQNAGLRLSAELGALDVEGVLGTRRMPVLSAVVARA